MIDRSPLECEYCNKQLVKRVCFLFVSEEAICIDSYGLIELDFCSKPCAYKWLDKNKSVQYFDVEQVQEERSSV